MSKTSHHAEKEEKLSAHARIRRAMGEMPYGAGIVPRGAGKPGDPKAYDLTFDQLADYLETLRDRLKDTANKERLMTAELAETRRDIEGVRRIFGSS